MKTSNAIVLVGLLLAGTSGQVVGQGFTGHAYLEGRNFMRDGVPFYPIVMNYSIEFMSDSIEPSDTSLVRLSAAGGYDMNYVQLECDDQPECDAQLLAHFAKLDSMGFNTIRLTGQRLELVKDAFGAPMLRYGIRLNNWYENPYLRNMVGPDFTDPWSTKFFNSFKRFLQLADTAGMNVIFLVSPASAKLDEPNYCDLGDPGSVALIDTFLYKLTLELKDSPALMAIDLINEPIWMHTDGHLGGLSKQRVCEITTRWYDSVHDAGPPYPLVTLGGYGVAEASSWDPAVMKLDFYSLHVYPEPTAVTDHDPQRTTERVAAEIHWLGMTCPMPWLIGETAFAADNDTIDPMDIEFEWGHQHLDADTSHHQWPYMDGSEEEQLDFASATLLATRNALGSGYSWWGLQNDRGGGEGTLPVAVDTSYKRAYLSNFFGVLKYGNMAGGPVPWNTARPWRDKQVVSAFQNADQSPIGGAMGAAPANYFNWHWLNDTIVSSGTVLDQNFDPVNAGIVEVVWPRYSPDNLQQYERQTFFDKVPLDSQGTYEIRQTPSSVLTNLGTYTQGNGVRSGRLHVTGGESGPIPNSLNALLFVEIERMLFAREVENLNIGIVDQEAYNAWSTVGLNSVIAQGNGSIGASLSAKARDVVSVSGESHFQAGSEVHLWTEPTYMDCGSNAYHMMQSSGSMSTLSESAGLIDKQRTIVLGFEMPEIEVRQDGNGEYALFVSHSGPGSWQVFDGSGKLIWIALAPAEQVQCPLTHLARGEYSVLWQSGMFRCTRQFIRP